MTKDYTTIPKVKVKSFEEFLEAYDFSYMDNFFVEDLFFRSMAKYDENNEMALDDDGYIVFDSKYHGTYIPTIYDKRIEIVDAYYEEWIYDDEHSDLNREVLKIIEASTSSSDDTLAEHHRTCDFEENQDGRWVLMSIEGILGYLPGK